MANKAGKPKEKTELQKDAEKVSKEILKDQADLMEKALRGQDPLPKPKRKGKKD